MLVRSLAERCLSTLICVSVAFSVGMRDGDIAVSGSVAASLISWYVHTNLSVPLVGEIEERRCVDGGWLTDPSATVEARIKF